MVLRVLWRRGNGNRCWGRLKRDGNESWLRLTSMGSAFH